MGLNERRAIETRLLHPEEPPVNRTEPLARPIVPSSVFRLGDPDQADALMSGRETGDVYARDGHPNARALAALIADLEGAEAGLIVSSGMAALATVLLDRLASGDRVLVSEDGYGKTLALTAGRLTRLGIDVRLVRADRPSAAADAIDPRTRLILVESISNPLLTVTELEPWAELARRAGALLVVDGTFAPPPILRALEHGADLVVHSLTKFLSGHSDVTLGAVVGKSAVIEPLRATASTFGFHAAAFDCWLTERGLATFIARIDRACRNAAGLAAALPTLPGVARVFYPGLAGRPGHEWLARRTDRFGNMVSFELSGGREAVTRLFRRLRLVPFCPSLGDARTTVSHPASTSHRGLAPEARAALGIEDGLVRVSVGLEALEDILADFSQALAPA